MSIHSLDSSHIFVCRVRPLRRLPDSLFPRCRTVAGRIGRMRCCRSSRVASGTASPTDIVVGTSEGLRALRPFPKVSSPMMVLRLNLILELRNVIASSILRGPNLTRVEELGEMASMPSNWCRSRSPGWSGTCGDGLKPRGSHYPPKPIY